MKLRDRFARFMQGRYGVDRFTQVMTWVSLILIVLSMFTLNIFWYIGLIILIYDYFRMFSRNISKRYAENQKYLEFEGKIKRFFTGQKNLAKQRKTHHIYRCPGCKQKIRVPRGKGKIEIRCPKCGTTFIKRS